MTDGMCQKWFVRFVVEISHWMFLQVWVDEIKLIAIKSRH